MIDTNKTSSKLNKSLAAKSLSKHDKVTSAAYKAYRERNGSPAW
jgi:hypothetical protein